MTATPASVGAHTLEDRFASGAAELREVYETHAGLVFALCRRTLDGEAAKEVTQDVFVSAWRFRHQFDPSLGPLAAWLVGITKRRIIDHVRRHGRHDDHRVEFNSELNDRAALEADNSSLDHVARKLLVANALSALPTRSRQVIEMAYIQQLTHQEIAERTAIPLGTIKSDIRRGLLRIRGYLANPDAPREVPL